MCIIGMSPNPYFYLRQPHTSVARLYDTKGYDDWCAPRVRLRSFKRAEAPLAGPIIKV